jgi:HD-GYP domain-containing protein (c-di-GMP phosphodiesterase class II)
MPQKTRTILTLAAAQAVCLAAGLWIHQQLERAVAVSEEGAPAVMSRQQGLAVHALTFCWIGGLQGLVCWLLMTRVQGEQDELQRCSLEESLIRSRELVRTRDAVIFGLAKLAESRDPDTGHHLERIALYSTRLASALRRHPKFRRTVTTSFVRSIGISSALHDIGKVGVEDSILLKPGPLTPDERVRIEQHTGYGGDCIRQIQQRIGDPTFLEMAREIALHHHERWDGSGYPGGLAGEQIPLAARIVAIADVYDALSVRRVYKAPFPHEACVERIRQDADRHFDPDLVEVFLSMQSQFREIAERFCAIDGALASGKPGPDPRARDHAELCMSEDDERLLRTTMGDILEPAAAMRPSGPASTPPTAQPAGLTSPSRPGF